MSAELLDDFRDLLLVVASMRLGSGINRRTGDLVAAIERLDHLFETHFGCKPRDYNFAQNRPDVGYDEHGPRVVLKDFG